VAVSSYLLTPHAMMRHDILTKEQEIELGTQVRAAQELQIKMQDFMIKQQQQRAEQQQQKGSDMNHMSSSSSSSSVPSSPSTSLLLTTRNIKKTTASSSSSTSRGWNDHMEDVALFTEHDILHALGVPGGRRTLTRTLRQGSMARQTLISSNVRLVVSIVKQWFRRGGVTSTSSSSSSSTRSFYPTTQSSALDYCWSRPSFDEVVQEGILGLVKAVERYDATLDLRFGTYATHWITSYVRRCFHDHATGCLKVPYHYHTMVQHYKQSVKRHYDLYHTAPTIEEVALELQVSPRRLRTILSCTQPLLSLDAPRHRMGGGGGKAGGDAKSKSDEEGDVLATTLACSEPRPEEQVEMSLLRQCLEHAMSTELSPHERDVVRLRLGLDDGVARTVRQVAKLLHYQDHANHMSGTTNVKQHE
jgi:RNA polymerase sigma factor (sigma-70 family)